MPSPFNPLNGKFLLSDELDNESRKNLRDVFTNLIGNIDDDLVIGGQVSRVQPNLGLAEGTLGRENRKCDLLFYELSTNFFLEIEFAN